MADLAELPAKFYSAGFRQESQGEGKDLEIYTTIIKTKLLKIWFWDNIPNVPHEIILEVKFWNMNSFNCSIIKELKMKKYQMRAHDAKACELTSCNPKLAEQLKSHTKVLSADSRWKWVAYTLVAMWFIILWIFALY